MKDWTIFIYIQWNAHETKLLFSKWCGTFNLIIWSIICTFFFFFLSVCLCVQDLLCLDVKTETKFPQTPTWNFSLAIFLKQIDKHCICLPKHGYKTDHHYNASQWGTCLLRYSTLLTNRESPNEETAWPCAGHTSS